MLYKHGACYIFIRDYWTLISWLLNLSSLVFVVVFLR